jgi:hypothetical protein
MDEQEKLKWGKGIAWTIYFGHPLEKYREFLKIK